VVATEVDRGLLSADAAREEYGVVLADDGSVDEAATAAHREGLRESRDDLAEFDDGPLPDDEELADRIAAERDEFEGRYD
jgi:N-methylhydantoinase B